MDSLFKNYLYYNMKDKLFHFLPRFIQEILISIYNFKVYRIRYGGEYWKFRELFYKNRTLSYSDLEKIQKNRFEDFVKNSLKNSKFYQKTLSDINNPEKIENLHKLPIVSKEELRKNIHEVYIDSNEKMEISKTGGTTGKSLSVKYTQRNAQERFAMLDDFRSRFGYELGKKTAWFSGKSLLSKRDLKKKIFWKNDYWYKVKYYSTFHIKDEYLKYYVEDLIKYKPEYLVGFPSTMLEIANYGIKNGYEFPIDTIKAIFPTAESITEETRFIIEEFFNSRIFNQYASSEGAPFIIECIKGNLHVELQSGVFEVLDDNNNLSLNGRLVLTSFTTEGTPLIRYDIGDRLILEEKEKKCTCGNQNPLVKEILGRIDDFIYSPENGKINLGNISNTLKDTQGIVKFQAIQNELNEVILNIVVDQDVYNKSIETKFINNWRERVGQLMIINIRYVDDISVEKSGKFRFVKNNIKHLL